MVAITALEVFKGNGAFQEYILLDEKLVWPVPDDMSDETAAQFVINPWTSYSMLKDLQVPKGDYMIQSAANSTLGKQIISLAKHWGIKTINVVRRPEAKAELKSLGADEVRRPCCRLYSLLVDTVHFQCQILHIAPQTYSRCESFSQND